MRVAARRVAFVALTLGLLLTRVTSAVADPAGPTDYRSEIVRIEPMSDRFDVRMLGGDSFLQLRAAEGSPSAEIVVVGYQGEPYLRFADNGVVSQNDRSPSTYLNRDRFGGEALPADADPDAAPVWSVVATGGSYAWHDHRTHWMNPQPPPGKGPGDQILEAVVPLIVDGETVRITVASYWASSRSPAPGIVAALLAVAAVAVLTWFGGARRAALGVLPVAGCAGLVAGLWAYRSLPGETGPSLAGWGLPLAVIVTAAAAWRFERTPATRPIAELAAAVAALELVGWGWLRRDWLRRSVLPTTAPAWLDNALTAAAVGAALACCVALGYGVIRRSAGRREVADGNVDN